MIRVAAAIISNAVLLALLAGVVARDVRAQENGKTVADGVYSDVQATRGSASYDASCARCHRADLGGADGPPLKDDRFAKNFAGKDLKAFYTKIATTMPRGAAGSIADSVYLDIVAHLLRENGFPSGPQELNAEALEGVRILPGRPKPLPPVGDFSYVEVVGCLAPGADGTWLLVNASDPVAVALTPARHAEDVTGQPLGTQAFRLLDAVAYAPDSHKGHKMYARGLLIKLRGEQWMTISALDMVASSCN